MSRDHIAIFLNRLRLGGAERMLIGLARALSQRGYRVDLVLVHKHGPLLAEVPDSVRIIELGKSRRFRIKLLQPKLLRRSWTAMPAILTRKLPDPIKSVPFLMRYLQEERPSALLTTITKNNIAALWAAALGRAQTRIVIREACALSWEVARGKKPFDRLVPDLVRQWYPAAHAIVSVSDGVAGDLADHFGVERGSITTIYNPVDLERTARLAAEPVEEPWFAPGEPPVLMTAGRLAVQKDHRNLLEAFARVRNEREARLIILGDGRERATLEALCRSLGLDHVVKMPGADPNPYRYMARARAFVLPSAWEGFPNVLMEALACGCPIVSTDCPSGPAELLDGGAYGRLVPVGDRQVLADAIIATLAAPREADKLRARARMFSVERAVDRYLELLLGSEAAGADWALAAS